MIRMPQFEPKAGQRWAEDDQIFQASFDQNRKFAIYIEHRLPCGTIAITYWVATIFGFNICKCNSIAENHWNCESELHIWGRRPVMPSLLIASEILCWFNSWLQTYVWGRQMYWFERNFTISMYCRMLYTNCDGYAMFTYRLHTLGVYWLICRIYTWVGWVPLPL